MRKLFTLVGCAFLLGATSLTANAADAQTIVPERPFVVGEDAPLWSYTPTEAVTDFYFEVVDFDYDVFEAKDDGYSPYLVFSEDEDGSNPITLNYQEGGKGSIYTGTGLEAETTYYIVGKNIEYGYFEVTLNLTEYEVAPSNNATLDDPFNVSSSASEWKYFNLEEGNYYLVSNSQTDLLESGDLQINTQYGTNIFDTDFDADLTAYPTEDGYIYSPIFFQPLESYTFKYVGSGSETISLTIIQGTYSENGPTTYLEDYAEYTPNSINLGDTWSSVELSWGVEVELVAETISIPVYFNDVPTPKGMLGSDFIQLQSGEAGEPGIATRADVGDTGTVLFILTGVASEIFDEEGIYELRIPAGLVASVEDGALNKAQEVYVTVVSLPEGEVSSENGEYIASEDKYAFAIGDEVSFSITYDEEVTANEEAEAVLYVWASNDLYEVMVDWATAADIIVVNSDKDGVDINLGEELLEAYYQLTLYEGALQVGDYANAEQEINFIVGDPSGISTIQSVLNGNDVIYNLQGQKVANPTKGIFIINGKKVLVK